MQFSVIHPTARVTPNFDNPWWKAADSAISGADNPRDLEYVLVVHHSRAQDFWEHLQGWLACEVGRFQIVINRDRDCLVDQCNAGMLAAQGEIQCWNQDDMRYPPHWDIEVSKLIPDTSELICIQARTDGGRRDLLTLPAICTDALAQKIGMLSPDYDGMFSDDEWSIKAWKFGRVLQSPMYFEHKHFTRETAVKDSIYALENREEAYKIGWEVFQKREALGFPRVPYPGETPENAPQFAAPQYPLLAMCIPGNEFSGAWFDAFMALGGELRDQGYLVKRFRSYYSNVYNTRIDLATKVLEDAKISGDRPKYVLWIDSDNVVMPQHLAGLLKFLSHYPQVDAVAGWCWIKKDHGWTTSVGDFWTEDGVHLCAFNADALFAGETDEQKFAPKKIEHTGFPLFLMRFEALEKLGPYAFRPLTKADLPAYFDGDLPDQEVADHWFCGEDTSWCLQAKKAGLTIVVDPGCPVGHLKLQLQAPITKQFTDATPVVEQERSEAINGKAVDGPPELDRVMSMI